MSVLDYFISSAVQDFVGVFDQNFNQVFPKARILKPIVKPTAMGMEHPIESGVLLTDHVIIKPIEIELGMIVPGADLSNTYEIIYNYFREFTLFTIQTKATNYSNMYILEMPHEEDPDLYDAISLSLKFKQALISTNTTSFVTPVTPKSPVDSTTVSRGSQQPTTPKTTVAIDTAEAIFGNF